MFRILLFIVFGISMSAPFFVSAVSTVWESLELGFYSRIHENIDSTIDTLRKKELSKFPTFAGFGSSCRGTIPWLDIEPMDEMLLRDITDGYFGWLSDVMNKNKILIPSDSDAYTNLALCLAETYRELGESAAKDEVALSSMWLLWLYSDGDTSNSDYDIVADVEKIGTILFAEKLDYIGKVNTSKQSFSDMAAWAPIAPIGGGSDGGWGASPGGQDGDSVTTPVSPQAIGIWDICSVESTPSSVDNIMDDTFLSELSAVMAWGTPPLGGAAYAGELPVSTLEIGSDGDFFHTPPCTDSFCIKIQMIPGQYWLMWGNSFSIESLLDKHIGIMEPIANSNLAAQEFSMNSYEQLFKNLKLKNLVGTLIYIDTRPQQQKTYKKEYTQEEMDKEFDEMQRCAYISAWLPSDIHRANILGWAWYQKDFLTDADTISDTVKSLSVLDPEESVLANCMSIGLGQARMEYYQSFSTDLTELETFTASLVSLISAGADEHKALDKKKVK